MDSLGWPVLLLLEPLAYDRLLGCCGGAGGGGYGGCCILLEGSLCVRNDFPLGPVLAELKPERSVDEFLAGPVFEGGGGAVYVFEVDEGKALALA